MEETYTVQESDATTTYGAFSAKLRNSLALVSTRIGEVEARAKAQWIHIPDQLRVSFERLAAQARDRLRSAFDLPSRQELADLLDRVQQLDGKLRELEERRGAEIAVLEGKLEAAQAPAPSPEQPAEAAPGNGSKKSTPAKAHRKETIRQLAHKTSRKPKAK